MLFNCRTRDIPGCGFALNPIDTIYSLIIKERETITFGHAVILQRIVLHCDSIGWTDWLRPVPVNPDQLKTKRYFRGKTKRHWQACEEVPENDLQRMQMRFISAPMLELRHWPYPHQGPILL